MGKKRVLGWVFYLTVLLITCIWAFWGAIENFHEGWYDPSFWKNIGLMLIQYMSPMFVFIFLTLLSVRNNKAGAALFLLCGVILSFLVNTFNFFVILPFFLLAVLSWFGEIGNKKIKYKITVFLPLIVFVAFSIEPAYRVFTRLDDGNYRMRVITGNGVSLIWAPQGPGWPDSGVDWYEADSLCRHLSEDGLTIMAHPQNIWRLPTVDEAVRSMYRHGKNCLGQLDKDGNPQYKIEPDKETPLWNPHARIIYWWTRDTVDSAHAYTIAYNGKIWKREKRFGPDYLGFRAVKESGEKN